MTAETTGELPRIAAATHDPDNPYAEPGIMEALRFLYARRVQLALRFIVLFAIGVIGFLYIYLSVPKVVEGTVGLSFQGIERHEYPTGRKFSVEDFRSPDVLTRALTDAGLQRLAGDLKNLAARIYVTPIIPAAIQARWRRQERDGTRRDEYFPSEFKIAIEVPNLSDGQRLRLFDALVRQFQERVKYMQNSAATAVTVNELPYEKLAAAYDFWDFPSLFRAAYESLSIQVNSVINETLKYPDPTYQLAFRNIATDLSTWYGLRVAALEAATYQGGLVTNRDLMMQRVQYRIEELNVQIQQRTQEAGEQLRLLGLMDRPKALLAGQLSSEKSLPIVDASALEKLVKSDYVGPVVARISKLQEERQNLEAAKARLQKQLAWLPKASNVDGKGLPSAYKDVVQTASSELRAIVKNYNKVFDEYLTATISSHIDVRQAPIITREGRPSIMFMGGIAVVSLLLAIALMGIEHLYRKVRADARTARTQ